MSVAPIGPEQAALGEAGVLSEEEERLAYIYTQSYNGGIAMTIDHAAPGQRYVQIKVTPLSVRLRAHMADQYRAVGWSETVLVSQGDDVFLRIGPLPRKTKPPAPPA